MNVEASVLDELNDISSVEHEELRSKNRTLWNTARHDCDVRGGSIETVWYGKTRMVWLPDGEKSLRICITVSTEYQRVMDEQKSCVCAIHSARVAKTVTLLPHQQRTRHVYGVQHHRFIKHLLLMHKQMATTTCCQSNN